jgi:hypothetical protein
MADMTKTVFGDLRKAATQVIRVRTSASTYHVAFHEERGRRYVIVRGLEGSDRENVVVRDSDPRIDDESMFDVPIEQWVGKTMEVATMRTSPIASAEREDSIDAAVERARMRIDPPEGLDSHPRIMQGLARGTNMGKPEPAPVREVGVARDRGRELARQVVTGEANTPVPYPLRHVQYAENVASLLRSIHRRERLFDDASPEQRDRQDTALSDAEDLLKLLLRRAKR